MNAVAKRKQDIVQLLAAIDDYPAIKAFKHEIMTYAYVLACVAIEFMVESTLGDWVDKSIKHHEKSRYQGKSHVIYFLNIKSEAAVTEIKNFHSTNLDKIENLIKDVAGEMVMKKFKSSLKQRPPGSAFVLRQDIDERLKRISLFRHELAHGNKMPRETRPNISELRTDFLFIYNNVIKNLKNSLPRT